MQASIRTLLPCVAYQAIVKDAQLEPSAQIHRGSSDQIQTPLWIGQIDPHQEHIPHVPLQMPDQTAYYGITSEAMTFFQNASPTSLLGDLTSIQESPTFENAMSSASSSPEAGFVKHLSTQYEVQHTDMLYRTKPTTSLGPQATSVHRTTFQYGATNCDVRHESHEPT